MKLQTSAMRIAMPYWVRLCAVPISLAGLLLAGLVGCGGGGGGGSSAPPAPVVDASPGGIWTGTVSYSTAEAYETVGVVTEAGFYRFVDEQAQQLFGVMNVTGTTVSGEGNWVLPIGSMTAAGSNSGTSTISGTVVERSRLTGSFTSTGEQGDTFSGTFSFVYDVLYERDSSLATVSGTYLSEDEVLTIDSQGKLFSQDPISDCVLNGLVSIIDGRYNAYNLGFEVANCSGEEAILNGLDFNGLAVLDNSDPLEDVLVAQADATFLDGYIVVTALYFKQ